MGVLGIEGTLDAEKGKTGCEALVFALIFGIDFTIDFRFFLAAERAEIDLIF